jgi:hypothetical protein
VTSFIRREQKELTAVVEAIVEVVEPSIHNCVTVRTDNRTVDVVVDAGVHCDDSRVDSRVRNNNVVVEAWRANNCD